MTALEFAILGLGAGSIYAILGLGLVLVYRGSGVINFAQGAMAMICAFVFVDLVQNWRIPLWAGFLIATFAGAALGLIIQVFVMRPLARASQLARLAATLGIVIILQGVAGIKWNTLVYVVPSVVPTGVWHIGHLTIPQNEIALFLVGAFVAGILWFVARRTLFGLAVAAVAQDERSAAAAGWAPSRVAAANWILAGALAGASGILITPIIGLTPGSMTLVVIPALAAAVVGGFSSYPLTLLGGIIIGVAQSEITRYVNVIGLSDCVPLVVVVVVLFFSGRSLPLRGYATDRLPAVGSGRLHPWFLISAGVVLSILMLTVFPTDLTLALTDTFIAAILIQSAVVLTGYAGQVSLATFALAGAGAYIAGRLFAGAGWPLELALLAGLVCAPLAGLVLALPALRTRGATLAVVTLAMGLAVNSLIFSNTNLTGGPNGTQVGPFHLFGLNLDPIRYPARYGVLCLIALIGCTVVLSKLRRSASGGRLIAIREGERAATALGISVFSTKIYAFAVSAVIASLGGILLAFSNYTIVYNEGYDPVSSIQLMALAVVGGIGFLAGALVGATLVAGTIGYFIVNSLFGQSAAAWLTLFGGVTLIFVLIQNPDGLFPENVKLVEHISRKLHLGRRAEASASAMDFSAMKDRSLMQSEERHERHEGHRLEIDGVSVRYGGVKAVSNVSLTVESGKIVGLVGPNGAGKTSLFDAISGLAPVATGEIRLDGRTIQSLPAAQRARAGIGRTFQSVEAFDDVSVGENVMIAAGGSHKRSFRDHLSDPFGVGRQRAERTSAFVAAVDEFDLWDDLDLTPAKMPFGRRRLVGMAMALASQPTVLLLDEPAAGLDDTETNQLAQHIKRLARDRGLAILVIEHDLTFVMDCSDTVTVLNLGEKIAEGAPDEIRRDPAVREAYLGLDDAVESLVDSASANSVSDSLPAIESQTAVAQAVPDSASPEVRECLLRIEDGFISYGDLTVVRGVDLEVAAGEVVALLGPNGAGKTSTLLGLIGALPLKSGKVWMFGTVTRAPLYKRARQGIAYLSESGGLVSKLTAEENLRLAKVDVEEACASFPELIPLLKRKTGALSGGEQRMLSLARALGRHPSILIIDELSQGLAPIVVARVLDVVRESANQGVAVLIVEQNVSQILQIADRAYVMRRGKIQIAGSASDISEQMAEIESHYLGDRGSTGVSSVQRERSSLEA